jgi:hypothetical protein
VLELSGGGAELRSVFASAGADTLVIVDWSAPWCGPCRAIRPVLDALAAEQPRVALVSINTEATQENAALAAEAAISAFPTFHAYLRGARVEEWRGANPAMLRATMQRHAPPGSLAAAPAMPAAMPAAMPPPPPPPPPSAAQLAAAVGGPMAAALGAALATLRAALPALPDFAAAVRALLTFVGNVVAHPSDARYRRVRTSNAAFAAKLGGVAGGVEAMRAFGFVPITDAASGESILLMSDEAASDAQLPAVKAMLEEALRAATGAGAVPPPQQAAASLFGDAGLGLGMGGGAMPAGLEDLLAGGIGGMGGMGGFGGDPSAAASAMAAALASNPAARAAAASLASNPAAMASMMQTPAAQAAMRQLAGNNPAMRALMSNPALMQQMASAAAPQLAAMLNVAPGGGMGGGMGGGAGGGGFQMPPPGTPAPGAFGGFGGGGGNAGGGGGVDPAALAAALSGMGAAAAAQQQGGMSEDEALAEAIRRSLEDAS